MVDGVVRDGMQLQLKLSDDLSQASDSFSWNRWRRINARSRYVPYLF
jgi:hypothetical protein